MQFCGNFHLQFMKKLARKVYSNEFHANRIHLLRNNWTKCVRFVVSGFQLNDPVLNEPSKIEFFLFNLRIKFKNNFQILFRLLYNLNNYFFKKVYNIRIRKVVPSSAPCNKIRSTLKCHLSNGIVRIVRDYSVVTNSIGHSKHTAIMANLKFIGFSLILTQLWALNLAQNAGDTLVLVDNLAIRETHSIFFKGLQGKIKCRSIAIYCISLHTMTPLTCQSI